LQHRRDDIKTTRLDAGVAKEILHARIMMFLRLMPLAIITNLASTIGLFCFFAKYYDTRSGLVWLGLFSVISILWYIQTRSDSNRKTGLQGASLAGHMVFSGATAVLIGFGYIYLYPRLLGYDKQMLMVAQVMYLITGASIASIVLRVALVWGSILSAAAYIAMILFEQEFRLVSLAGFSFVLGFVIASNLFFYRINQERFRFQIMAETREQELSMIFDQSPISIVMTDLAGTIVRTNKKTEELSGYSAEELLGQNPRIMRTEETPPSVYQELWDTVSKGKTWTGQFINRDKHGTKYVEKASISPIIGLDGKIKNYMAIKEDMTLQRGYELQLQRQSEIIELLLQDFENQSDDWLWELGPDLKITYISNKILKYIGDIPIIGQEVSYFMAALLPPDDIEARNLLDKVILALHEGKPFKDVQLKLHISGVTEWFSYSAVPLLEAGSHINGWRGVGHEITDQKNLELQLHRRANFDEVTGLPNRHRFQEIIEATLGTETLGTMAILGIINLGKLDPIRAELGSSTCNMIIDVFIQNFHQIVGADVILARLTRNEFAFWAVEPDADTLHNIHRFAKKVNESLHVGRDHFYLDLYMGLAFYPEDAADKNGVFRAADLALNGAMAISDRKVMRYQEALATAFVRRLNLIKEFSTSLETGLFQMYYQPQVDSTTGRITGAEALIRWKHPHYGMVSPGEFVPLAEQSGFIIAMGEWCLFQACSDAMAWDQDLKVSVNVSGVQLRDTRSIIRVVKRALSESSLPPARLTLEITESAMLGNGDDIIDLLAELRKIGVSIALDDFGTGYSSLAYIQRLQLDTLKIDQTFVRKLNDSDNAGSMISIIIDLANLMHLETVAEGIEDSSQAAKLRDLGCTFLQGYLYGKPMNQESFQKLIPGQTR